MKKIIAMMLCIVLVLSLVACGNTEEITETTEETTEATVATETTEETTEETSLVPEEITEETEPTEEEFIDIEMPDFKFIEYDADYMEIEVEPTEDMLLLQSLYDNYPADQRPTPLYIRVLTADEYAMNYLPTDIEGLEVIACESPMGAVAHFTSIINVPEGTDPQVVIDYINANIDPELRSKWCCVAAETYELEAVGNKILFIMTDTAFAQHCVNSFNEKMAG